MGKNEVPDDVGPLDWVMVGVVGLEEPRVLFCDEVSCHLVCPEDVVVVWVEVDAVLLALLPDLRDVVSLVGLVDDFWDQLGLRLEVV